ncbi:MAG: dihydroorotate dehydrogenase electron transfer subunit [Bacteroidales bacterium]|jgi:dihydroorotate dehydrogenase electron transfer subunit|nr:dihydroorotate dehydrogenase electron transfer subunit [Bacteroidales bacterium]
MEYFNTEIKNSYHLTTDIFVIETGWSGASVIPGQFFMLKAWGDELPLMRPISLYKIEKKSLQFMIREVGKGTQLLSKLPIGASISLLGPSGNGFPCDEVEGKIALVGGGVGIPPLYETAKKLMQQGKTTDLYLGYKNEPFAVEEFKKVCTHLHIATEDGSVGHKGFVTEMIRVGEYDALFTCGPDVMMSKLAKACREEQVTCWVSVERHMGCGIGACLVCNCKTDRGMLRACKDGPIFPASMLIDYNQ